MSTNVIVTTVFGIHVRRQTLNAFSLFTGLAAFVAGIVNLTLLPYATFLPRPLAWLLIIGLLGSSILNLAFFWANRARKP